MFRYVHETKQKLQLGEYHRYFFLKFSVIFNEFSQCIFVPHQSNFHKFLQSQHLFARTLYKAAFKYWQKLAAFTCVIANRSIFSTITSLWNKKIQFVTKRTQLRSQKCLINCLHESIWFRTSDKSIIRRFGKRNRQHVDQLANTLFRNAGGYQHVKTAWWNHAVY